jgi:hypothetical protein
MSSSDNLFKNLSGVGAAAPVTSQAAPAVSQPVPASTPAAEEIAESETQVTELSMLKQRATLMGVSFSNNISVETLRARIQAKLDGETQVPAQTPELAPVPASSISTMLPPEALIIDTAASLAPVPAVAEAEVPKVTRPKSIREQLMETEMALVRLRITNLDPKKKDLPGEILTVANEYLGTVRKYIPYGEVTDNGFHVPMCLYRQLLERTFVSIKVRKVNGREHVESQDAREFSLEVLEPLTADELSRLAASQSAAGGLS